MDYAGNIRYRWQNLHNVGDVYNFWYHFDDGYLAVMPAQTSPTAYHYIPSYHYQVRDHQGNIRVVVDEVGNLEQKNEYFAYGGPWVSSTNQGFQPYKYNGKELDRIHGLDWYDYGARRYDPACCLFTQIDPLAEKYPHLSPYAYCAGNPVRYVDLFGEEPTPREAAYIAEHVYGKTDELIGGWQQYYMNTLSNGLQYGLYQREKENGEMEYVLAFAGTNDLKDVQQDLDQFTGVNAASQYGDAIVLGGKFASLYAGYEKTIVGHSLGGGLATAAAMYTEIPAITFNPAAITESTKAKLAIQDRFGKNITNYVVFGEPLSVIQSAMKMSLPGNTIQLFVHKRSRNPFVKSFSAHKISTIKQILPR